MNISIAKLIEKIYILCLTAQVFVCLWNPIYDGIFMQIAVYTIHIGVLAGGAIVLWVRANRKESMPIVLLLACCVITSAISDCMNYETFVNIACFLETILVIRMASYVGNRIKSLSIVYLLIVATIVCYVYQYALNLESNYSTYFLGLNKNYSGMQLLLTFSACLAVMVNEHGWKRILFAICAMILGMFLWISRCRTAQIIFLIEMLFFFWRPPFLTEKKMILVTLLIPLMMAVLVLAIPALQEVILIGHKKTVLNGRELLYMDRMMRIVKDPIWGNLSIDGFSNAHNGPLAIMASIGLVGYLVWFVAFYWTMDDVRREVHSVRKSAQSLGYVFLLCCMLNACTEAAFYVHGQQIAVMISILVLISQYYGKNGGQYRSRITMKWGNYRFR